MRVRTKHTGIEAEAYVLANGIQCEEFILARRPTINNDEQALKECYVPVASPQEIMITGYVTGVMSRARFDLIVDGSFVGTRLVEPDKDGNPKKHARRRLEFRAINSVMESDSDNTKPKIVEAELYVTRLQPDTDEHCLIGSGRSYGVGTIVVIISIEESFSNEGYWPDRADYSDRVLGNWQFREDEVANSGVIPTHCLNLQNIVHNVIPQKCNKFQSQFEGTRYGTKPFAKMVFHYRSKDNLLEAGCMPCPQKAYPVEPLHKELTPIMSDTENSSREMDEHESAGLFMPGSITQGRAPLKKKLGGTLVMPKNHPIKAQTFRELVVSQAQEQQKLHDTTPASIDKSFRATPLPARLDDARLGGRPSLAVMIGGQQRPMLGIRAINELIPEDGVPLVELLQSVFPDLPRQHRNEAGKILINHMRSFVEIRQDEIVGPMCFPREPKAALKRGRITDHDMNQSSTQSPRFYTPQGLTPRHNAPQTYTPREYAPQGLIPQSYTPREYTPLSLIPQGYTQRTYSPAPKRLRLEEPVVQNAQQHLDTGAERNDDRLLVLEHLQAMADKQHRLEQESAALDTEPVGLGAMEAPKEHGNDVEQALGTEHMFEPEHLRDIEMMVFDASQASKVPAEEDHQQETKLQEVDEVNGSEERIIDNSDHTSGLQDSNPSAGFDMQAIGWMQKSDRDANTNADTEIIT